MLAALLKLIRIKNRWALDTIGFFDAGKMGYADF
jgi:hypothetical protein